MPWGGHGLGAEPAGLSPFTYRYGTNWPLLPLSPSALMQLPRASNERFMLAPSTSRTPRFWVAAALVPGWKVHPPWEGAPGVRNTGTIVGGRKEVLSKK